MLDGARVSSAAMAMRERLWSRGWAHGFYQAMFVVLLGTLALALVAVPLAMLGVFRPIPLGVGIVLVWGTLLRLGNGGRRDHPPVRNVIVVLLVTFVGLITALNLWHSSQHLQTNRDPGVYVNTALVLADAGGLVVRAAVGPFEHQPSLRYELLGFYEEGRPGRLEPQFLHLLPAFLAVGEWLGGAWLLVRVNAILGGLALVAFFAFASRLMRDWLALLATLALGINLVQVHFTRDAFTEILTQLFLFAGLWVLWEARTAGRDPGKGLVAGLFLGATCMTRIDAFVYLIPLTVYLSYEAFRMGRYGKSRFVVAVGMGLTIGPLLGLVDGWLFTSRYFEDLTRFLKPLFLALLLTVVVGAAAMLLGPRLSGMTGWFMRHRGTAATVSALLVLLLAGYGYFLRPELQRSAGSPVPLIAGLQGQEGVEVDATRRYAELSLHWLSWYMGPAALIGGIGGAAWAVRRAIQGKAERMLPFLGIFLATSLLYVFRPSISPDHIWAMRRFLPVTIPGLLLLGFWWADILTGYADRHRSPGQRSA